MSEGKAELGKPEFKTWPFESFGQVLKVSGNLDPEIFPYRISLPKDSAFFKNVYNGLYRGRMTTVFGSEKGKHPIANGVMVEHMAILAANDIGEVMVSKAVFQGDFGKSLTDYSQRKMIEYNQFSRAVRLPPGWRRFGDIHSHPIGDVLNSVVLSLGKGPEVGGLSVTWSGGDFESLVEPIDRGFKDDTVMAVITPVQISFMVATKKTLEVLERKDGETTKLLKVPSFGLPPYKNFEKLGLVLYVGNHVGLGKDITLHRLIY